MNEQNEHKTLPASVTEAVESVLGEVQWLSQCEGFARCPGANSHSHRTGRKDCKVYLDRVPTISCFHASCEEAVKAKNVELRRVLANPLDPQTGGKRRKTPDEKARIAEFQRKEAIRRRALASRERTLRDFRWPVAEICRHSPTHIPDQSQEHWRLHLGLFRPEDVVWIGDIFDSGKQQHAANFRRRDEWIGLSNPPGAFTCPAVFKEGSIARSNNNVAARRFLVVESDILRKDEVGAIFRWMREQAGLKLRAIVDTGGKSLHGWFDLPGEGEMQDLRLILPEWDCDPKLFTPSQPVRLAGVYRGEKNAWQRLLFLDQGGAQ